MQAAQSKHLIKVLPASVISGKAKITRIIKTMSIFKKYTVENHRPAPLDVGSVGRGRNELGWLSWKSAVRGEKQEGRLTFAYIKTDMAFHRVLC